MALPQTFPEQNLLLTGGEDRPDIITLPCWFNGERTVSCWRLTWRERFSVLFFGKVWLAVLGTGQPPVAIEATNRYFVPLPDKTEV